MFYVRKNVVEMCGVSCMIEKITHQNLSTSEKDKEFKKRNVSQKNYVKNKYLELACLVHLTCVLGVLFNVEQKYSTR